MLHNLYSRLHILLTVLSCFRRCEIFVFLRGAGGENHLLPNYCDSAEFLSLSPLTRGARRFFVAGWGAVPCAVGSSEAVLASIHQISVKAPRCDNQKCLQTSSGVPWLAEWPLVENHCLQGGLVMECIRKANHGDGAGWEGQVHKTAASVCAYVCFDGAP